MNKHASGIGISCPKGSEKMVVIIYDAMLKIAQRA